MDYLLSREFDAHQIAIFGVARSVVIVLCKLRTQCSSQETRRSFDFR